MRRSGIPHLESVKPTGTSHQEDLIRGESHASHGRKLPPKSKAAFVSKSDRLTDRPPKSRRHSAGLLKICTALVAVFMTEEITAIIWLSTLGEPTNAVVDLAKVLGVPLVSLLAYLVHSTIRNREGGPPS